MAAPHTVNIPPGASSLTCCCFIWAAVGGFASELILHLHPGAMLGVQGSTRGTRHSAWFLIPSPLHLLADVQCSISQTCPSWGSLVEDKIKAVPPKEVGAGSLWHTAQLHDLLLVISFCFPAWRLLGLRAGELWKPEQ